LIASRVCIFFRKEPLSVDLHPFPITQQPVVDNLILAMHNQVDEFEELDLHEECKNQCRSSIIRRYIEALAKADRSSNLLSILQHFNGMAIAIFLFISIAWVDADHPS
jgi:hypothetical protein